MQVDILGLVTHTSCAYSQRTHRSGPFVANGGLPSYRNLNGEFSVPYIVQHTASRLTRLALANLLGDLLRSVSI
jgi:hypothetical protein